MYLLKLTALTSVIATVLSAFLELYFGFSAKPYLFGFPRFKWPLLSVLVLIWAIAFWAAYYVVFQRRTFYGG
jgi:hypothetical protein